MNEELPKMPSVLAARATPTQKKMQAIRLAKVLSDLHEAAQDRGRSEAEGVANAQQLAMAMLRHFDVIVWALRTAGGARNP